MDQINVFVINDVVRHRESSDMLSGSDLTRMSGEQEQAIIEQLRKPIRFR